MKRKIIIVLLLVLCIGLTGCSDKLSEKEIKGMLEVNTDERTFTVNEVKYATDKITINDIDMQVKDNTVTLGDYSYQSYDSYNLQITGYYDQSAATYNIYRLSEDENGDTMIWKLSKNDTDSFEMAGWENTLIFNASDLILIDCVETDSAIGQTPTRYQVYALVNNELVLVD